MSRFLSPRLSSLEAYVPGEQPGDLEYIKLNTNESPYPPAPGVFAAISHDEIAKLSLYPNPDGCVLQGAIAERYGVLRENVIIGNGSDELLAFAFLAFAGGGRGAAFPDITYGFYPVYAALYGAPFTELPLAADFTITPHDYFGAGKMVVLANPNAPTGIALPLSDIEAIVRANPDNVVLIDEAYVDFGGESAIPLIARYDNLLVLHTFSKSRSLAGARLAYAIGNFEIIGDLNRIKFSFNPYNVNRLTQLAGVAALKDAGYYADCLREIVSTREYATSRLNALGFTATESRANFIFARHSRVSGKQIYRRLKERGILVRRFDKLRISEYLRITVGTREQMDALILAVSDILKSEGAL